MRLRTNEPATLEVAFYDDDEKLVDPGATTIGIAGYAGQVVAAGTATTGTGADERKYSTTPPQVDHWTVTWTAGTRVRRQYVNVVGEHLFELAELRTFAELNDVARYSTRRLQFARDAVSDLFESYCGVAFVPQHRRVKASGVLQHPNVQRIRSLLRATVNGVVMTTAPVLWRGGLDWTSASPLPYPGSYYTSTGVPDQVVLDLEVGYDSPPEDIREAAVTFARHLLLERQSRIPDRATNLTTPEGTFQLTYAGKDRPTGLPIVDSVLNRYRRRTPVFA